MTPIEMAVWRLRNVITALEEIPSGTNVLAIAQIEKAIDDITGESVNNLRLKS